MCVTCAPISILTAFIIRRSMSCPALALTSTALSESAALTTPQQTVTTPHIDSRAFFAFLTDSIARSRDLVTKLYTYAHPKKHNPKAQLLCSFTLILMHMLS